MRALVSLAAMVLVGLLSTGGCPLAPGSTPGLQAGEPCRQTLDCGSGLVCVCGACVTATDDPDPPSCEVSPDNRCPATASSCFMACGDETVVGLAECLEGRETCASSGGVLRDECDPTTCWGEPAPGEACINGEWECMFARNETTGLCFTFDCEGDPEECVMACTDDERTTQICLANQWTCEVGFEVSDCGGCVGTPPDCFDNCDDLNVIAQSACLENEWACSFIEGAQLESDCCAGQLRLLTEADYIDAGAVSCSTDEILVRYQEGETLTFRNLKRARALLFYENEATRIEVPKLERVDGAFSMWMNPNLRSADLGSLEHVGGSFEIAFNDSFPQCRVTQIVNSIDNIEGQLFLTNNDPTTICLDDGGVADGGPLVDAGLDGGVDAGQLADHILLCELSTTATDRQFVEIANRTGAPVDLSRVYLTDDSGYASLSLPADAGQPVLGGTDFVVKFPDGTMLPDGQTVVVAINGATFQPFFGFEADFEIRSTTDNVPDMISIQSSAISALTTAGEHVTMFEWDGGSPLMTDIDIMAWGTPAAADAPPDKTGLVVGGSPYQSEASDLPGHATPPAGNESTKRIALEDGQEVQTGGNGLLGHDETSENTDVTWDAAPFTDANPGICALP